MSSPERTTSADPKSSPPGYDTHAGPPAAPPRSRSGFAVSRDSTPIYYEVTGRHRPASTLLLCDGIGCTGYVWRYLQRMLAEDYRIIHLNYRGHGQTPAPRDPQRVSISDLADDVITVLDACETDQAILCGHSMGVQVCLETYRRAPDRVQGLLLFCGSYGNPLRTFKGKSSLEEVLPLLRFTVGKMPSLMTTFWTHLIPTELAYQIATRVEINGPHIRREDFWPYLQAMSQIDVRLFLNMLAAAGRHTAREILPTITVPTLVIAGRRDSFTPVSLSEEMHREIPASELHIVEDGSHTAPIERPKEVLERVRDFLTRRLGA